MAGPIFIRVRANGSKNNYHCASYQIRGRIFAKEKNST